MQEQIASRISSGIEGLDELLAGGLIPRRRYLVRGAPGQGKTTLGLHFLTAAGADEPVLFIGFQEPENELRANAASMGIDVAAVEFLSLSPDEEFFTQHQSYDVFAASDVEQGPLVESVVEAVERIQPTRVFVDSLTQLRFLSADVYQYRKQALSFLRFLTERGATVLFTSESSAHLPDDDLQFLADGVISLELIDSSPAVVVRKFRGSSSIGGVHQLRLNEEGLRIFPRMRPPAAQVADVEPVLLGSGNEELDSMLHGGLEAGTVTLLTGPTGIGKSTLAGSFAIEAARQGRRAAVYLFEEELNTFLWRMRSLELDIDTPYRDGRLLIEQVEPLRYLVDEFTSMVRHQVERDKLEVVVLDSVTGLELAMEGPADNVGKPLHAFAKTLCRLGVTIILVNENELTTGRLLVSERDISYLADNVVYMRYVQPDGSLQKIIGVLKKRLSGFDNGAHQFSVTPKRGICVDPISADIAESITVGAGPESSA